MIWIRLGALFGFLAVMTGAFAAHGMTDYLQELYKDVGPKTIMGQEIPAARKYLNDFKTGAEYQMYHALALVLVGGLSLLRGSTLLNVAGWAFTLGIVLFSGSLYVLVLTKQPWMGMITPLGGLAFLVGWSTLARANLNRSKASDTTTDD